MRMPPLPADFIHAQALQTNLRKTLDTTTSRREALENMHPYELPRAENPCTFQLKCTGISLFSLEIASLVREDFLPFRSSAAKQ